MNQIDYRSALGCLTLVKTGLDEAWTVRNDVPYIPKSRAVTPPPAYNMNSIFSLLSNKITSKFRRATDAFRYFDKHSTGAINFGCFMERLNELGLQIPEG